LTAHIWATSPWIAFFLLDKLAEEYMQRESFAAILIKQVKRSMDGIAIITSIIDSTISLHDLMYSNVHAQAARAMVEAYQYTQAMYPVYLVVDFHLSFSRFLMNRRVRC